QSLLLRSVRTNSFLSADTLLIFPLASAARTGAASTTVSARASTPTSHRGTRFMVYLLQSGTLGTPAPPHWKRGGQDHRRRIRWAKRGSMPLSVPVFCLRCSLLLVRVGLSLRASPGSLTRHPMLRVGRSEQRQRSAAHRSRDGLPALTGEPGCRCAPYH